MIKIPTSNHPAAIKHFHKELRKITKGHGPSIAHSRMLAMQSAIHEEVAPVLDTMRKIDLLINSGLSLVSAVREMNKGETIEPFRKADKPALPTGLRLPPNVCTSPRITI